MQKSKMVDGAPIVQSKAALSFSPSLRALAYVLTHKNKLLTLTLPGLLMQFLLYHFVYQLPPAASATVLIEMLLFVVRSWLILVIAVYFLRNRDSLAVRQIWIQAFKNIPKVFFCYLIVSVILWVSITVPPGLLLVIFLVWAPVFCAFEIYAPQNDGEDVKNDSLETNNDPDEFRTVLDQPNGYFSYKGAFELGIVRSVQYASRNMGLSFKVLLITIVSSLLPQAIIVAIFNPSGSEVGEFIPALSSYPFEVLGLAWGIAVFCFSLPPEALEEISLVLPADKSFEERCKNLWKWRLKRSNWLYSLLLLSCLWSFPVLLQYEKSHYRIPESVNFDVIAVERKQEGLIIDAEIEDSKHNFRWFKRELFWLMVDGTESKEAVTPSKSEITKKKATVFPIGWATLRDDDDQLISIDKIYDSRGSFKLRLFFPLRDSIPKKGECRLLYGFENSSAQLIWSGYFPYGFGVRR